VKDQSKARPRLSRPLRWLFRAPGCLYRCGCGRLLGHRFLLLVHVGRRTGRRRRTVLEVVAFRPDGPEAVVVSGFGHGADWLRNIQASPNPAVTIGSLRFTAETRFLGEAEAMAVMAAYERRSRYFAPIIRQVLSRLLGWRYDGSDDARRQMIVQLPLVAFRPRPG
jgi:deazaflavin-dependent oxidoreductase (nitroreductase family)